MAIFSEHAQSQGVSIGPLYIAAFLRQHGHTVVLSQEKKDSMTLGTFAEIGTKLLDEISPNIIGFTCLENNYRVCLEKARWVKSNYPNIVTVFGGIYPTLRPEIVAEPSIDAVCIGEGEKPMLDLCNRLKAGTPYYDIDGLHVKRGSEIIRNKLAVPIEDLDLLPPLPRSEVAPFFGVHIGRGCPYACTFCAWAQVRKASNNKKIRMRSARNVIDEISTMHEIYGRAFGSFIKFHDDTFTQDIGWVKDFLPQFHRAFPKMRFACQLRADTVHRELVQLLAHSGCQMVAIGYECGDESIRNDILGKNVTNEEILGGADLLHKAGIQICGQWMFGIPGESISAMLKTVDLHRQVRDVPYMHICTPYYGTKLRESAVEQGLLPSDTIIDTGTYNSIFFNYSEEHKAIIRLMYRLFPIIDMPIDKAFLSASQSNYVTRKHGQRDVAGSDVGSHLLRDLYGETKTII